MGTHNDNKSVSIGGFKGSYWDKKAEREAQAQNNEDNDASESDVSKS